MSAEVLKGDNIAHENKFKRGWYHDAIHDIESLFWVFLYMCLTRRGPGGPRREELESSFTGRSPDTIKLRTVVFCLFDGPREVLYDNKGRLLGNPDHMREFIIPCFHPYFDDLKDLALKWWKTLVFGYQHRMFEYDFIHTYVLRILRDDIVRAEGVEEGAKYKQASQKELVRRQAHRDQILNCFPMDTTTAADAPSTPPSQSSWGPHTSPDMPLGTARTNYDAPDIEPPGSPTPGSSTLPGLGDSLVPIAQRPKKPKLDAGKKKVRMEQGQ